jgi:hypothetical protein
LAVSVAASGGCTAAAAATGYDVKITSGTNACVLTASQGGNGNYDAAQDAQRTVSVQKAQLTVTADNKTMTYADPLPTFTYQIAGFVSPETLATSRVQFTVKKFGGAVQTTAYATADGSGNATTTASVPTSDDPYTVEVQVDPVNSFWTSGLDVSSLQVIVGSGTGRTAGGGWIPDAANDVNGKSNFGFTVQNSKTGIKGNSLFIYRVKEGNNQVQYVLKSNSWQGGGLTFNLNNNPTRATFTGKATLQRYVNGVFDATFNSGGYTFTVDDFDGDLLSPRVTDGYAVTVRNGSNAVVKQLGSRPAPITLGGGNVLIQSG